jgi:hypothetical protein
MGQERKNEEEPRVFRVGGVSYLRISAEDPRASAAFYEAAFGWSLRGDPEDPSFEDGSGHVIGHFVTDQAIAGEVVTAPYSEGDLLVATVPRPRRECARRVATGLGRGLPLSSTFVRRLPVTPAGTAL